MVKSFITNKIEIKESNLDGKGMFAKEAIKKDEIVFIKGGHLVTREQLFSSGVINSYLPIDDNYFIGSINKEEEDGIKLWINHSCEPNCGMRGEISFVAMRDIKINEELSIDYALVDNEDYKINCNCKSKSCRSIVTGFDWKIGSLQKKYGNYFALYLLEKIKKKGFSNF